MSFTVTLTYSGSILKKITFINAKLDLKNVYNELLILRRSLIDEYSYRNSVVFVCLGKRPCVEQVLPYIKTRLGLGISFICNFSLISWSVISLRSSSPEDMTIANDCINVTTFPLPSMSDNNDTVIFDLLPEIKTYIDMFILR